MTDTFFDRISIERNREGEMCIDVVVVRGKEEWHFSMTPDDFLSYDGCEGKLKLREEG